MTLFSPDQFREMGGASSYFIPVCFCGTSFSSSTVQDVIAASLGRLGELLRKYEQDELTRIV